MATFTGQDTLTGFAFNLSDLLWRNETNKADPYRIAHAGTSNSGFSFGAIQWDLVSHNPLPGVTKANTIFEDILDNAIDINGQRIIDSDTVVSIINKIYVTGNANALSASEKALIDLALGSAYGIEQINANHVNEINAIVAYVDN